MATDLTRLGLTEVLRCSAALRELDSAAAGWNHRPGRRGWFTTVWARKAVGCRMIHDHS